MKPADATIDGLTPTCPAAAPASPSSAAFSGTLTAANMVGPADGRAGEHAAGFADVSLQSRAKAYGNVRHVRPQGEVRGQLH